MTLLIRIVTGVAATWILGLPWAGGHSGQAAAQVLERPPYLQIATPTSIIIRWRTSVPHESHVSIGPLPTALGTTLSDPALKTEHEIAISGLDADTRYYYSIASGTGVLAGGDAMHFFRTVPAAGNAVSTRIWILGDSGITGNACLCWSSDIRTENILSDYQARTGDDPADVILMLGDNAYGAGRDEEYTDWMFKRFAPALRNSAVYPALGSHEVHMDESDSPTQSGVFFDSFTLPAAGEAGGVASRTEAYYSFDHGLVHFVVLDTEDTPYLAGSPQLQWLAADLAANTREWTIAYWHRPAYTKTNVYDSDNPGPEMRARENILPILESLGVDLGFSGNSHVYERSRLIDGHYGLSSTYDPAVHALDPGDGDPAGDGEYFKNGVGPTPHLGTVYTTLGSTSLPKAGPVNHPVTVTGLAWTAGSVLIDAEATTLTASFIDDAGTIRDTYRIRKLPAPPADALSAVWTWVLAAGLALLSLGGAAMFRRQRS